jgi:hypothetical protein
MHPIVDRFIHVKRSMHKQKINTCRLTFPIEQFSSDMLMRILILLFRFGLSRRRKQTTTMFLKFFLIDPDRYFNYRLSDIVEKFTLLSSFSSSSFLLVFQSTQLTSEAI